MVTKARVSDGFGRLWLCVALSTLLSLIGAILLYCYAVVLPRAVVVEGKRIAFFGWESVESTKARITRIRGRPEPSELAVPKMRIPQEGAASQKQRLVLDELDRTTQQMHEVMPYMEVVDIAWRRAENSTLAIWLGIVSVVTLVAWTVICRTLDWIVRGFIAN